MKRKNGRAGNGVAKRKNHRRTRPLEDSIEERKGNGVENWPENLERPSRVSNTRDKPGLNEADLTPTLGIVLGNLSTEVEDIVPCKISDQQGSEACETKAIANAVYSDSNNRADDLKKELQPGVSMAGYLSTLEAVTHCNIAGTEAKVHAITSYVDKNHEVGDRKTSQDEEFSQDAMAEVRQTSPRGLVGFETGSGLSFAIHLTPLHEADAQPEDQRIEGVTELYHRPGEKSEPISRDENIAAHDEVAKGNKLNPVELYGSKSDQKAHSSTPGNVKSGVDCRPRSTGQHNVFESDLSLQKNITCEAPVRSEFNKENQRQETSARQSSSSCLLKPLVELASKQVRARTSSDGRGEYKGGDSMNELATVAEAESIHSKDELTAVQIAINAQHFELKRESSSLKRNDNWVSNLTESLQGRSFTPNEKFGNYPYSVLHSARVPYPFAPARVYASPPNSCQFEGDSEPWTEKMEIHQAFPCPKGPPMLPGGGPDMNNQVSSQLISDVQQLQKKCEFLEEEIHAVFRQQATMQRVLELESERDSLKREMGRQLNQLNTYKNQNAALSCRVFDLEVECARLKSINVRLEGGNISRA